MDKKNPQTFCLKIIYAFTNFCFENNKSGAESVSGVYYLIRIVEGRRLCLKGRAFEKRKRCLKSVKLDWCAVIMITCWSGFYCNCLPSKREAGWCAYLCLRVSMIKIKRSWMYQVVCQNKIRTYIYSVYTWNFYSTLLFKKLPADTCYQLLKHFLE